MIDNFAQIVKGGCSRWKPMVFFKLIRRARQKARKPFAQRRAGLMESRHQRAEGSLEGEYFVFKGVDLALDIH